MGRPRIYDEPRIATAIRLPASLREELHAAATERDVSVNFLVTRAISDYLGQLSPPGAESSWETQPYPLDSDGSTAS